MLASALAAAGIALAVVNPRRVRDFAEALGKLAETDRVDAAIRPAWHEHAGLITSVPGIGPASARTPIASCRSWATSTFARSPRSPVWRRSTATAAR